MAKHTITHSCGHTTTADIVGPMADRPRKETWLRSQPCGACRRSAAIDASKAQTARDTSDIAAIGLPLAALTGSDKQVAWATDIRARAIATLDRVVESGLGLAVEQSAVTDPGFVAGIEAVAEVRATWAGTADTDHAATMRIAKSWIDMRDRLTESDVRKIVGRAYQAGYQRATTAA